MCYHVIADSSSSFLFFFSSFSFAAPAFFPAFFCLLCKESRRTIKVGDNVLLPLINLNEEYQPLQQLFLGSLHLITSLSHKPVNHHPHKNHHIRNIQSPFSQPTTTSKAQTHSPSPPPPPSPSKPINKNTKLIPILEQTHRSQSQLSKPISKPNKSNDLQPIPHQEQTHDLHQQPHRSPLATNGDLHLSPPATTPISTSKKAK